MTNSKRKYQKEKRKTITLEFYPPEEELYKWLKEQKPTQTFIKNSLKNAKKNLPG